MRVRAGLATVSVAALVSGGGLLLSSPPAVAGAACGSSPTWTPLASTPDGASCSLRDVLDNLAGDGDMVLLEAGATYPVDFDECSSIDIDSSVTIQGNGATVLIDCLDSDSRAFDVEAPDVIIDNVVVTTTPGMGGGGGINVEDDGLLVTNSTIVNNLNCFQLGGGMTSIGNDYDLVNSTVTGNMAFLGGGLAGGLDGISDISLTNSTVSGNLAGAAGGGIFIREGMLTLVYSDVVNNQIGIAEPEACVEIAPENANGTVWAQGGPGITPANILLANIPLGPGSAQDVGAQQVEPQMTTFASVIALPIGGVNCGEGPGPLTNTVSNGYNFSDDASCDLTGTGDRESAGSPLINALANNGGPTPTHLPAAESPLIDGVPLAQCQADGAAGVSTDQRGITRPQSAGCDIGSVEIVPAAVPAEEIEIAPTLAG